MAETKVLLDYPPNLVLDVIGKKGKKVPVVAAPTLPRLGETELGDIVYQRGAGGKLTLEQELEVQRLTQGGKADPGLERRVMRARKIRANYVRTKLACRQAGSAKF